MDKMKDDAPSYVMPNDQKYAGSPVGYPDLSGRNPESYKKVMAEGFKPHFSEDRQSHSNNPERHQYASMDELRRMKLAK